MDIELVIAGINLSATIINFIADKVTEAERAKQLEIDIEIDRIRSHYQESAPSGIEDSTIQNNAIVVEKKKALRAYLQAQAEARESEFDTLHKEIKESKKRVISALRAKNTVQTQLRKSSLELLLRQLSEAQEKCYSYIQYLKMYCEEVGRTTDDEPPVFCMHIPSNYPYIGKIIWIHATQLSGCYVKLDIANLFSVTVYVSDKEAYEINDKSRLPMMITDNRRKEFKASLEKGAFKANELVNTHLGLSATVKEIGRNHVILTYQNQLELYLPKNNLIKPDRYPPIRSSLTVFPVNWEYNLEHHSYGDGEKGYPVTVSERKEDARSSLAFNSFPICFSEEELSLFREYYEKNDLQDYDEEFLIGPVSTEDVALKKGTILKLQFGDIPLMLIEVDEHKDRSDILRFYFRFRSLCGPEEKTFSADDIFLPFDVSFTPYFAGTSTEMIQQYMDIDDIDDVAALIWDLFEEFRIQDQIRKDRKGMGYFFKWESITNQLITVLEQGDSIKANVRWDEAEGRNTAFATVLNLDAINTFIRLFAQKTDSLLMREWRPQFFVKDDADQRYVTTIIDGGRRLRIVGKNASEVFRGSRDSIDLYVANRPYAEYQQRAALRQFRIGQVVNPVIQAACLNSASIVSCIDETKEMVSFHNEGLASNASQRLSVEKAFREKHFFLIQGPPGTGKTTVIKELVEQVLKTDAESRILIVSQANVAVDNALSGLIQKYGDHTVRCGNGNKISETLQKLRLQNRCQDYLDDLNHRRSDYEAKFFEEWENTVSSGDSDEFSPVLCELIIRSHRLIGATCVGLARRNIGLERTQFDLVVVDEAGKALPAEMIIPLIRAKKAVIIGDQNQLPPVINPILYDEEMIDLEERAISENDLFCHSFFERLYENAPDSCKSMLDTQYRMPAVLGTAISNLFYHGKLKNGSGTELKVPVLFSKNITFINFDGISEYEEKTDKFNRITNDVETHAAVSLVAKIRKKDPSCSIAVITPYKGQKHLLCNAFIRAGIHYQINGISVDTIDSFQGSEADVVVFCTTRAVRPTLFFKDTKRLNVALSRAKRELIILGKIGYFYKFKKEESCLPAFADYIKENGTVIMADKCELLSEKMDATKTEEMLLSISAISLPTAFYTQEYDKKAVQDKINEYYKNGDFVHPLIIEQQSSGYILKDNFEQYRAAQDLGLEECLCLLV